MRQMHRRLPRIATTLWLATFALPAHSQTPQQGGSLTMGTEADFAGWDARRPPGSLSTLQVGDLLFDRLMVLDVATDRLIPQLAESMTESEDHLTYTYALRTGVTFHDGAPFNAEAVAAHWQRLIDLGSKGSFWSHVEPVAAVTAVGPLTVRFTLKRPWSPFPRLLATHSTINYVGSPKAIAEMGDRYWRQPVGTGPFVFKEWRSGDRVVVERNPNYWRKGQPHLDRVTFRVLPDDEARLASVASGTTDVIFTTSAAIQVKAMGDAALNTINYTVNGADTVILNTAAAPLDDIRVRRALAHAIDRSVEAGVVYKNLRPLMNDVSGFCEDAAGYPAYDPARARTLLAEYGRPVKFKLNVIPRPEGSAFAQLYQEFWRRVGIDVEIAQIESVTAFKQVVDKNYNSSFWRIRDEADPDFRLFASFLSASSANYQGYKIPEIDTLLNDGRRETDPGKRKQIYCELGKVANANMLRLLRGKTVYSVVARKAVHGIPPTIPVGVPNIREAWIAR